MEKVLLLTLLCITWSCSVLLAHAQTDATKSTASGAGLSSATIGFDANFEVTSRDSSGVVRTSSSDIYGVSLSGPSSIRGVTSDGGSGVHAVSYIPYVKGSYSGSVKLEGPSPSSSSLQFTASSTTAVQISSISALKVNTYTTESWIKTSSVAAGQYFMGFDTGGYSAGMQFGMVRCGVLVGAGDFKLATTLAVKLFNDDKWHHIACTMDGSVLRTFVDGVLQTDKVASGNVFFTGTSNFYIGQSVTSASTYFDGKVDEVRIWNSAKSAADISALYLHKVAPTSSGLIGYWQIDEGSGTTVADSSSSSASGSFISTPTWTSDAPKLFYDVGKSIMSSPFTINVRSDTSPVTGTGTRFSVPYQGASVTLQAQDGTGNDMSTGGLKYKLVWTKSGDSSYKVNVPATDLSNGKYLLPYNITDRAVFNGVATHEGPAINKAALSFSGSTQYVLLDNSPAFDVAEYTLEVWFKTSTSQYTTLVSVAEPLGYRVRMHSGGKIACYASNSGYTINAESSTAGLNDGAWHHAACVLKQSGSDNYVYTFVDGAVVANATLPSGALAYVPNIATVIGGEVIETNKFFNGILDEVKIWNKPFTSAELADSIKRQPAGSSSGLIAYWSFDEGVGSVIGDKSSTGASGTIVGATWVTSSLQTFDLAQAIALEGSTLYMCSDYPTKPAYTRVNGFGLSGGDACVPAPINLVAYNIRNETKVCSFDNVTVTIQAPKDVVPTVTPLADYTGNYSIVYFPSIVGSYVVDIMVEGERIPSSPFTANYVPGVPSATMSFAHGPNLYRGQAGASSAMFIQARDGCMNNRTSDVGTWTAELVNSALTYPLSLNYEQNGRYGAYYNLTSSGIFALNVKLDGGHINGSPFSFVQAPGVTILGHTMLYGGGLSVAYAGQGAVFTIQARDMFFNNQTNSNDNFLVDITGPGTVFKTLERYNDGRYVSWYNITKVGSYQVSVTLGGVHAPGSPYTVTVKPGPTYPDHSVVTGGGLSTVVAGDLTSITVTSWDRFANQKQSSDDAWLIKMVGPDTYTLATQAQGNGVYFVPYNITLAGTYSLQITLDGVHISGSPITVIIKPGPASPMHTVTSASVLLGVAGDNNVFTLQPRDRFRNNILIEGDTFTVSFSGPKPVTPSVVYSGNGLQTVTYNTTKNGDYTITVLINGAHVLGSPFASHVNAAAIDTAKVEVAGNGLVANRIAGTVGVISIISRDRFGNQRSEWTTDSFVFKLDATRWPYATINSLSVSAGTGGAYTVIFNATLATDYKLTLKYNSVNLASSPYDVNVAPNVTHSAACIALGVPSRDGIAGEIGVFHIQARDTFGNNVTISGDEFALSVTGPHVIQMNASYVGSGQHMVVYYETLASTKYVLTITRNGDHIDASPIPFTIHPAPAYGPNSYILPGAVFNYTMVVGEGYLHPWSVQGVDRFGNNRTSAGTYYDITMTPVSGGVLSKGIATYLGGTAGQYSCIQNATVPGVYALSIVIDGMHLIGSPMSGQVTVNIGPPFGGGCLAWGGGQMWTEAGFVSDVFVQTRDKYGNNRTSNFGSFEMALTGPETRGPATTQYRGAGLHHWSYNVTVAGPYTLIGKFLYDNFPISGSPFSVVGAATETVVSGSYAYGPALTHGVAGVNNPFYVQAVDRYGNNATHPRSDAIIGTAAKETTGTPTGNLTATWANGVHKVTYYHTVPGVYDIRATLNGIDIPGAQPWKSTLVPGPAYGPKCSMVGPGLTGPLNVGQEGVITNIKAYDQFGNARTSTDDGFTVQLTGPSIVNGVVEAISGSPGEYSARYNVTVEGTYALNVKVNGLHVFTSPRPIVVKPQTTFAAWCSMYGPGLTGVVASTTKTYFYIQARDGFGNNVTSWNDVFAVSFTGPSSFTEQAVPSGGGLYKVQYSSTVGGDYTLSVTLAGKHIQGSPYALNIAPATFSLAKCTAESGHENAYAGTTNVVLVQSRDIYGNKRFTNDASFTVTLTGPQSAGPMPATYIGNGQYKATYYVVKLGTYTLTIESGSTSLTGSPFTVTGQSGPANVANSILYDKVLSTVAGQYVRMKLQLMDSVGNNRTLSDDVRLHVTVGTTKYNVTGAYMGAGLYNINTQTTIAGDYSMVVYVNDVSMPSMPLTTTLVADAIDQKNALFYGAGMTGAEERATVAFYIQLRDQYGNKVTDTGLTAWIIKLKNVATSVIGPALSITEVGNGVYASNYTAGTKGAYQMLATTPDSATVNGSPFTVTVTPYIPRVVGAAYATPSKLIIHVTYDEGTDHAMKKGSFACSDVLGSTAATLGTGSWCSFRDAKTLGIFLGNGATIVNGNEVIVKGSTTKNSDKDSGYVAAKNVTLTTPSLPSVNPVAVLRGPYVLADSQDLKIDASSSYGGTITAYSWKCVDVISTGGIVSVEDAFKNSVVAKTTSSISYPASDPRFDGSSAVDKTYVIEVTVTNNYGLKNSTRLTFKRIYNRVAPSLSIDGPTSLTAVVTDRLDFTGTVNAADATKKIVYSWHSTPAVSALSGLTGRALSIPPSTLTAGVEYSFELRAYYESSGASVYGSTRVVVTAVDGKLQAILAGGNRTVSGSFELDASASVPSGLTYKWLCVSATTSCPNLSSRTESKFTLTEAAGTYVFEVTVTKDGVSSVAYSTITVVSTTIPNVVITKPYKRIGSSDIVSLDAKSSISGTFVWSVVDGDIDTVTVVSTSSTTSQIALEGFHAGQHVTLSVTCTDGGGAIGKADALIDVVVPPLGGSCAVSLPPVSLQNSTFGLSCTGWVTDEEAIVSYSMNVKSDAGTRVPLTATTVVPVVTGVLLPPGSPTTVEFVIMGAMGERTVVQKTVTVLSLASIGLTEALAVEQLLAAASSDCTSTLQTLMSALPLLNSATGTTLTALRQRVATMLAACSSPSYGSPDDVKTGLYLLGQLSAKPDQLDAAVSTSVSAVLKERLNAAVSVGMSNAEATATAGTFSSLLSVGSISETMMNHLEAAASNLHSTLMFGRVAGQSTVRTLSSKFLLSGRRVTPGSITTADDVLGTATIEYSPSLALTGQYVDVMAAVWARDPYEWKGINPGAAGNVTTIIIKSSTGSVIAVTGGPTDAVKITQLYNDNPPTVKHVPTCQYWDTTSAAWSSKGCQTVAATHALASGALKGIQCQCSHTTNFAVRHVVPVVATCVVKPDTAMVYISIVLGVLALVGVVAGILLDNAEAKYLPKKAHHALLLVKSRAVAACRWSIEGRFGQMFGATFRYQHSLFGVAPSHGVGVQFTRPERSVVAFAALTTIEVVVIGFATLPNMFADIGMQFVAAIVAALSATAAGAIFSYLFQTLQPPTITKPDADSIPMDNLASGDVPSSKSASNTGCCGCGTAPRTWWLVALFYLFTVAYSALAIVGTILWGGCLTYAAGVEWLVWWAVGLAFYALVFEPIKILIMTWVMFCRSPRGAVHAVKADVETGAETEAEVPTLGEDTGRGVNELPDLSPTTVPDLALPTEEEEEETAPPEISPLMAATLESLQKNEYDEIEGTSATPMRKLPPIGGRTGVGAVAGFTVEGEDTTGGLVQRSPWEEENSEGEGDEDELAMSRRFRQTAYGEMTEGEIVRYFSDATKRPEDEVEGLGEELEDEEGEEVGEETAQ